MKSTEAGNKIFEIAWSLTKTAFQEGVSARKPQFAMLEELTAVYWHEPVMHPSLGDVFGHLRIHRMRTVSYRKLKRGSVKALTLLCM